MNRNLSDDVRLVGDTLGDVLRAQGGEALFDTVEAMRVAAKEARDGSDEARARLDEVAHSLDATTAIDVVRAFTLYFQLVNLAEDENRARELRRRELSGGGGAVAESLHAVVASLKEHGATAEQVLEALADIHLRFVFTAHPTEARRRTTERLLTGVRDTLSVRDRRVLTPTEQRAEDRRLRAAVESLWEHAPERLDRPEVLDEVKAGLFYLEHVLLDQVPRLYRRIARAIRVVYEREVDVLSLPSCVDFGSWMGSDRDGNPFVTDAVTERTLELHRLIVLTRYDADLAWLVDQLAATEARVPPVPALVDALVRAAAAVPEVLAAAELRNPHEPLRRLITFARERLLRARTFAPGAYAGPRDLLEDLAAIRASLVAAGATALPDDRLLDLMLRVRAFGFQLAALDVREDSAVHRAVVAELSGRPDYPELDDAARRAVIEHLRLPERGASLSPEARRLLGLFSTVTRAQARFGPEALSTYAISMTESAADVLEVLRLAQLHRCARQLDVVPLLETPEDLDRAGPLLSALFSDPGYRAHLRERGDVQELLLGYSDSMKQGGILSSRVRVAEAQRAAAAACREHGITLRIFHGRGGSVSRGGGPTHRAIGALPREAFSGLMKITEQGEMRSYNFANPDLAARYLEQTLGAALAARHEAKVGAHARPAGEAELLERLAAASQRAYRAFVEDPEVVTFFQQATPLSQIAALNLASRPSKRRGKVAGVSDLRAIPWVFAWSQSRYVLTGWYGVGSALEEVSRESSGAEALRRAYRESPFLRDLMDNVEMTLAKSDIAIAARYAALTEDAALGSRVHARIAEELERTKRALLVISGEPRLLDDDEVLAKSIRLRNPYVDPMSYVQVQAIRRARESEDDDARASWERVARAAVQGIAAGLRHTG